MKLLAAARRLLSARPALSAEVAAAPPHGRCVRPRARAAALRARAATLGGCWRLQPSGVLQAATLMCRTSVVTVRLSLAVPSSAPGRRSAGARPAQPPPPLRQTTGDARWLLLVADEQGRLQHVRRFSAAQLAQAQSNGQLTLTLPFTLTLTPSLSLSLTLTLALALALTLTLTLTLAPARSLALTLNQAQSGQLAFSMPMSAGRASAHLLHPEHRATLNESCSRSRLRPAIGADCSLRP